MSTQTETKSSWMRDMVTKVQTLAEDLQLDDDHTVSRLRDFVLGIAKEQYMIGNRSGISWMRRQMNGPVQVTSV